MSLAFPRDCLAYHKARAFTVARPLSDVLTADIGKRFAEWSGKGKMMRPEAAAITFYGLNHAVAEISKHRAPHDKMTQFERELVEAYYEHASQIGLRNFYYLLLITTREARHLKNKAVMKSQYAPQFGAEVMSYIGSISDDAASAVKAFTTAPPKGTLGNYVGALSAVFHNGSWSSGFGGKAWGGIADCLLSFVQGHTSMEGMTDTVFTLAHNNGPIYNKGVLFQNYGSELVSLLDVQASGQIPNGILNNENNASEVFGAYRDKLPVGVLSLMRSFGEVYPEFQKPIDWFKVKALGGKLNYFSWMQEQVQKYGPSPYADQVLLPIGKVGGSAKLKPFSAKKAPAIEAVLHPLMVKLAPNLSYVKWMRHQKIAA